MSTAPVSLPRGIPAASLKRRDRVERRAGVGRLPRGIPAASLKRCRPGACTWSVSRSSAGNTRGLIEAVARPPDGRHRNERLPRGIPAASLKPARRECEAWGVGGSSAGNTRGLIEAMYLLPQRGTDAQQSSAGNTRGLIEARPARYLAGATGASSAGNTRGLIEAKSWQVYSALQAGLPRGIPAASLKRSQGMTACSTLRVFRGEYPRPH